MTRIGALLALLVTGCGSKGAVSVLATIEMPHAAVAKASTIALTLNGDFTLHLELGSVAPSSTDVSISGGFALVRPSDQLAFIAPKLDSKPPPPYHLEPGGHVDAAITIAEKTGTPGQMINQATFDAICQSRSVQFSGTLSDSQSPTPTPVSSLPFDVTGCP